MKIDCTVTKDTQESKYSLSLSCNVDYEVVFMKIRFGTRFFFQETTIKLPAKTCLAAGNLQGNLPKKLYITKRLGNRCSSRKRCVSKYKVIFWMKWTIGLNGIWNRENHTRFCFFKYFLKRARWRKPSNYTISDCS